jgi:hypothetical protein
MLHDTSIFGLYEVYSNAQDYINLVNAVANKTVPPAPDIQSAIMGEVTKWVVISGVGAAFIAWGYGSKKRRYSSRRRN